jgi:hypothetical protein
MPPVFRTKGAALPDSRSASIAASSSGDPMTLGPLNHFRADTSHQIPANPITIATAIGA